MRDDAGTRNYTRGAEIYNEKNEQGPVLLVYDDACTVCRSLAELVHQRQPGIVPQPYSFQMGGHHREGERPASIKIIQGDQCYEDQAAWAWLLASYRDLKPLGWLAEKLGIATQTAAVLRGTAHRLRRLCRQCR